MNSASKALPGVVARSRGVELTERGVVILEELGAETAEMELRRSGGMSRVSLCLESRRDSGLE